MLKFFQANKIINTQRGAVAILLSVLVLAAVLVMGLTIAGVVVSQIAMTNQATQSVRAFYAADAGAELCLYQARKLQNPCNAEGGSVSGSLANGATYLAQRINGTSIQSTGFYNKTSRKVDLSWAGGDESLLALIRDCADDGGTIVADGEKEFCRFSASFCPLGWTQYNNFTETEAQSCDGSGSCGTSVTSGFHSFGDIDPATDARTYYDGVSSTYACCPGGDNCCIGWDFGQNGWWVCVGYTCCGWTNCTSCTQTEASCASEIKSVGCVPD